MWQHNDIEEFSMQDAKSYKMYKMQMIWLAELTKRRAPRAAGAPALFACVIAFLLPSAALVCTT